MSDTDTHQAERLTALTEDDLVARSEAAGEPAWLRDRRLEAFKRWVDQDWPRLRGEEAWVATPFNRIHVEGPLVTAVGPSPRKSNLTTGIDLLGGGAAIVDGGVAKLILCAEAQERGVVLTDLATAARDHEDLVREHLDTFTSDDDRTITSVAAAWTAGVVLIVPDEVELDEPFLIRVHVTQPGVHAPRVLIILGHHARARVYIEHTSDAVDALVDEVVEIVAGDGARLDVSSHQDWADTVDHLSLQRAALHRDAHLRHLTATFGGRTVRIRPEASILGAGAKVEPLGVYFADEGQHFELRPWIDHIAGHGVSDVLYKGALQGRSRVVFRGNIYIGRDAAGTDSNETNKSLILTDGARADSTPFLEIECSDVKAGHGSATGQVDEDSLFYLTSRGIPTDEALRLIVFGFFEDVLERIDLPGVHEHIHRRIQEEVDAVDLLAVARRGRATTPDADAA